MYNKSILGENMQNISLFLLVVIILVLVIVKNPFMLGKAER
jgi:hypothetical protein